jgi:cadmium resistance protein CadD (predicted permease)
MFAIIPAAAGAYAATNMDNFILLVALLARYRQYTASVVAGFVVCTLTLVMVGLLIA